MDKHPRAESGRPAWRLWPVEPVVGGKPAFKTGAG